jgi:Fe(3+) dicitrate transport protein
VLIPDSINAATGDYNNRTVDIDNYRNWGVEARYLGDYKLFGSTHSLSTGVRYFRGNTYRYRDGKGTTGSDYTIALVDPVWPRDIDYKTDNVAVFAENIFRITDRFIVIPGFRYDWINAEASGINGYSNGAPIFLQNQQRSRGIFLAGVGAEYHLSGNSEIYANITQAYRPMQFADLTAPPTTNEIDPNLQDATGFNADLGYRGRLGSFLYYDMSLFFLQYNNRIGTISQQRADGSFYNLTTNVGNSTSKGFEGVVEFNPVKAFMDKTSWGDFSVFASYSYTDARFGDFNVVLKEGNDLVNKSYEDKYVENAPLNIFRGGLTYNLKGFSITGQVSYVDRVFADANNTGTPTANGQNGVIPSYTITDISAGYVFNKHFNIKAGVNNLTNEMYFTRRAGGYPGPGLLPADGRNFFTTVGITF